MKTIIAKRIAAIFGLATLFTSIFAQTDTSGEKATCNAYMRAPYMFEGKVDSSKYFTVKIGDYDYENFTAYLVEVDKVLKGNIKKGTIEIVQYADGIIHNGPDGMSANRSSEGIEGPPAKGIFLGFDTAGYRMASYYKNSNFKTLRCYGGISVVNGKIAKDPRGGIGDYFSTLADFYAYISANYGINVGTK